MGDDGAIGQLSMVSPKPVCPRNRVGVPETVSPKPHGVPETPVSPEPHGTPKPRNPQVWCPRNSPETLCPRNPLVSPKPWWCPRNSGPETLVSPKPHANLALCLGFRHPPDSRRIFKCPRDPQCPTLRELFLGLLALALRSLLPSQSFLTSFLLDAALEPFRDDRPRVIAS